MIGAHYWLAGISGGLWPALLHHLWQATLFTGLVWLFCLLAKRTSARTRYGIWLLASFKFALPAGLVAWIAMVLDVHVPWPTMKVPAASTRAITQFPLLDQGEQHRAFITVPETGLPRMETSHSEFYCGLTLAWGFGAVSFLWIWWHRHRTLKTKLRRGKPLLSGPALETLSRAKVLLKTQRPMALVLSSDFPEPGVCGIRNPKLVLPKGIIETLTNQELEAIFLHEVAHIRRHDNLASMFHSWLCCVFWFHPVIWLIDRQLLIERERACDEEVLSHSPRCQEYFSGLLKVLRWSLGKKLVGASLITGSNLKRRIDHMLSYGSRKNTLLRHRLSISGFLFALIVSVTGAAVLNQGLVAQNNPELPKVADTSRNDEAPAATLQSPPDGVHGEVRHVIESSVTGGISGGGRGEAPKLPHRSAKQPAEPPLTLAANQTPQSPVLQAGSASLSGIVSDASQARVPDATLIISSKEGGIREITISGVVGEYEFRALPPGRYSIEVRKPGFRICQQQAIELRANEPRNLDVVLEVGEVNQTVNVVAKAPPAAPPDPRSGPPRRIRVGGNVQATKLVHQVTPVYPERSRAQGIQGSVLLDAIILKDGSLGEVRVLNKLADPDLVDAAVEAVKNWRYEPTLLNGQPVEVVTTITVNFRLSPL